MPRYRTRLLELPDSPPGRSGWPWTNSDPSESSRLPDESARPRISVVTASLNQAPFIEETIRSVLLQAYPALEYLIIDAGSTDGSVDIIRKYSPWLDYWISEPDRGQVYALAKGFARSSGSILAFLNSDDVYLPGALNAAAEAFTLYPDAVAICGNELWIDDSGVVISEEKAESVSLKDLLLLKFLPQPAIFFRRSAFDAVGGFNLQFQYIFDFELWLRLAHYGDFYLIPNLLAATRWHVGAKRMTSWPTFPMELERAIPSLLAGPLKGSLTRADCNAIRINLGYYAARVYWSNLPKYTWNAIVSSVAVIAKRPSLLPALLKHAGSCMLRLLKESWRKVRGQKSKVNVWWADKKTGVYWADWQSHSQVVVDAAMNAKSKNS